MPAPELRIGNRTAYFRKAIKSPDFHSERVLARDAFQFAELWLARECPKALPFWSQARSYYLASRNLPARSSPLTSYFCFLNAAKTLLTVKGVDFSDYHGVSGAFDPLSKRALSNETITFKGGGILPALSTYLEEEEKTDSHTLTAVLSNLPFIHRAYRYTFRTRDDILDNITITWLTNTALSAARLYWEYWGKGYFNAKGVSIPVAVSVFPDELYPAPRSWTERAYPNLIHYNKLEKGGHFAAWEQPELFCEEVRAGLRPLRNLN